MKPATDLRWIHSEPDPKIMAAIEKAEIEEALTATSRPRHWAPVEIDPALLR